MAVGKQEYLIIESIDNAFRLSKAQALLLGGKASSSGGSGVGPPGGIIGYLPQARVSYDLTEAAYSGTPASGMSIVDNLNHIRYRVQVLEETGGGGSGIGGGQYRQFLYEVSSGTFSFITDEIGNPIMVLEDLE